MTAFALRGDARSLPLPPESVNLIVTSPPFWQLRSYQDGGKHYDGQIGSERTWQEYIANLLDCTREWMRVLRPTGSLFVELGDKYSDRGHGPNRGNGTGRGPQSTRLRQTRGPMEKSLLDLPSRYSIRAVDELGLIKRANIIWHHANPLPESVTDRVRVAHSIVFHFTKQPRYYSAVDEIREPHTMRPQRRPNGHKERQRLGVLPAQTYSTSRRDELGVDGHPLGSLPGSVWDIDYDEWADLDEVWRIPSQPLTVPAHLGINHFASFPMELPRRIILGWSPPAICLGCGEGRRPVTSVANIEDRKGHIQRIVDYSLDAAHGPDGRGGERWRQTVRIVGYACACTPYTDHPGTGKRDLDVPDHWKGGPVSGGGFARQARDVIKTGPWREYHLDRWDAPPTRPAVILDPFCGTGTTLLVADVLGRKAIGVDLSNDYCRMTRWRVADPGERARAMQVPKPPPVPDGQGALFSADEVQAS